MSLFAESMKINMTMNRSSAKVSESTEQAGDKQKERKGDTPLPGVSSGGKCPEMNFFLIGSQLIYLLNILGIEESLEKKNPET